MPFFLLFIFLFFNQCQQNFIQVQNSDKESIAPEKTTHRSIKKSVSGQKFMLSTANPHATQAGFEILKHGGSAADAAITVQMVLNLVEPQSSGIGGGLFALFYNASEKKLTTIDGRETAPKNINPKQFIHDGKPMDYFEALVGGQSVGTPGALKVLWQLHQKHGKLPWKDLFQPAIELSQKGFPISPRLYNSLKTYKTIQDSPSAQNYFFHNKQPKAIGTILKNPKFAKTLSQIANNGPNTFYEGSIAKDITQAVQNSPKNPGTLNQQDLKNYQAKERPPICLIYRQYKVCGMAPPTSGGIAVLQILGLLENFPLHRYGVQSIEAIHLFAQASQIAYADRDMYVADPDFVTVPTAKLLDKTYLRQRAQDIQVGSLAAVATAGKFKNKEYPWSPDQSLELPSTSHFSIVDTLGNAISLTSSIEFAFGSTILTNGFLLNNQLTDFSFVSDKKGKLIANRIQPGKRPRSSMAPMMVFDQNHKLILVIGSPGGSRIIDYVAKTILAVLDWKMDIQKAIDSPHYINRNGPTELEESTAIVNLKSNLEKLGHRIKIRDLNSGLHGIYIQDNHLFGGADNRREGTVLSE